MDIFLGKPKQGELKKLSKLIACGVIIPVMNDTKWRELISEMRAFPEYKPQFRVKDIFGADGHVSDWEGYVSEWDGEFYYHIHPVQTIEWMELRATSLDWLRSWLQKHSVPYSLEEGYPRVWGYTRPGAQPSWHVA